ncbi:hypothetical protein [Pseudobacteriovorax antillogorgiicola]|nr:hypothetical protein [Pseudobacteriovorax antillogorgiicola]
MYALVVGANFESITYIIAAWFAGDWLDENYPRDFTWSIVTYLLGLILIIRSWYVMFRIMIRAQNRDKNEGSGS